MKLIYCLLVLTLFSFHSFSQQTSFQTLLQDSDPVYNNLYVYSDEDLNTYVYELGGSNNSTLYKLDSDGNIVNYKHLESQQIIGSSDSILVVISTVNTNGVDSGRVDFMRLNPDLSFDVIAPVFQNTTDPFIVYEMYRTPKGEYYVFSEFPIINELNIKKFSSNFNLLTENQFNAGINLLQVNNNQSIIYFSNLAEGSFFEYNDELHIRYPFPNHYVFDKHTLQFLYETNPTNFQNPGDFPNYWKHKKILHLGDTNYLASGAKIVNWKGSIYYTDLAVGEFSVGKRDLINQTIVDTLDNPIVDHTLDYSKSILSIDSNYIYTVYISSPTGDTNGVSPVNNDLNINVVKLRRSDYSVVWKFQHQDPNRYLIKGITRTYDGGLVLAADKYNQGSFQESIGTLIMKIDSNGNYGYHVSVGEALAMENNMYYHDGRLYELPGAHLKFYTMDGKLVYETEAFGESYTLSPKLKNNQMYLVVVDDQYNLKFVR